MRFLLAIGLTCSAFAISEARADIPKKEDVPKNIGLLKTSKDAKARAIAAEELGRRGSLRVSDVEDALEPLMEALKDKDAGVRKAAAIALGSIGTKPTEIVPAMTDALKAEKNLDGKLAIVEALAKYGREASSSLSAIREFAAEQGDNKKTKKMIQAAINAISGAKKK